MNATATGMLATTNDETRECFVGPMVAALRRQPFGYRVKVERFSHWTFYVDAENGDKAIAVVHRILDQDGIPYMSGKNGAEFQKVF